MNQSSDPKIRIAQVFVSSVGFSHREDALSLPHQTDLGNVSFAVNVEVATAPKGDQGLIRIILQTKPEEKPLYSIRVEMIGMVVGEDPTESTLAQDYLVNSGAFMMYPFLREFIANLTTRGRFGPLWIRPINFKKIAEEMQQNMAQSQQAGPSGQ